MNVTTRSGSRAQLNLRERKGGGWTISGTIGLRAKPQRLTAIATNPQMVLNAVWEAALHKAGIEWDTSPRAEPAIAGTPRILAEVVSAPFDSIASEVNRHSHNLGAELLLQWAGGQRHAAELLTTHVRDVTGVHDGVHFVDGSGLSYDDRATARAFVTYLAKLPTTPGGRNFPQLLPANGTGTLRRLNVGFPGEGVLRAKTGTLNRVSTVVGYLGRPDGVLLVALMYNGDRPWAARDAQWKLFRLLGANGVIISPETTEPPAYQMGGDSTD